MTNHSNITHYNVTGVVDSPMGIFMSVPHDDNTTAAIIMFSVFLVLAQLLCVIKECRTTNTARGYIKGRFVGEEGIELVANSLVEDAAVAVV